MSETTKDKLNKIADWYSTGQLSIDIEMIKFRFEMERPFFRGDNVLELGPAEGQMTKHLVNSFKKVTVVEGAESLLAQIPQSPNLFKVHSLFEDWEPNERFDTIIMDHILEHVDYPIDLLSKVKSWLSPKGVLLVGVPNAHSFHRLAAVKMGILKFPGELDKRDISVGHQRVYNPESFRKDLLSAGFNIAHFSGLLFKPLAYSQMERIVTPEILSAFIALGKDFPENSAELFAVCEK